MSDATFWTDAAETDAATKTEAETATVAATADAAAELIQTGADFHRRGWSLATSSNYSVRLSTDPLRLLITASGKDKGRLTPADFVVVDGQGACVEPGPLRPSAETLLHVVAAQQPEVGAVLHTHSVWGTVLSLHFADAGELVLEGYEMLKGLEGIGTHQSRLRFPIVSNTQDMPTLAWEIADRMQDPDSALRHGYLIAGHGLYTWGRTVAEARRQVEALEFLFEVKGRQLALAG